MLWETMETAPRDGTPVLLYDGMGILHGRFIPADTYEDFLLIAEDGATHDDWIGHDKECRDDPGYIYDDWAVYELGGDDCVIECQLTHWCKPDAPKAQLEAANAN